MCTQQLSRGRIQSLRLSSGHFSALLHHLLLSGKPRLPVRGESKCINYFSHCLITKYLTGSNLRKEGFCLTVCGFSHHVGRHVAGTGSSRSHCACSREAGRDDCWSSACCLLRSQRWYHPCSGQIFPPQIQSGHFLTDMPRLLDGGVDPAKLTIRINHRSGVQAEAVLSLAISSTEQTLYQRDANQAHSISKWAGEGEE